MTGTMAKREAGMTAADFRKLLDAHALTQTAAAARLGYSFRQVNRWCNGRSVITTPVAVYIRKTLRGRR